MPGVGLTSCLSYPAPRRVRNIYLFNQAWSHLYRKALRTRSVVRVPFLELETRKGGWEGYPTREKGSRRKEASLAKRKVGAILNFLRLGFTLSLKQVAFPLKNLTFLKLVASSYSKSFRRVSFGRFRYYVALLYICTFTWLIRNS